MAETASNQPPTGEEPTDPAAYGQPPGTYGQPTADEPMFGQSTTTQPAASIDLQEMLRTWQMDRTQRHEDAHDWSAFRRYAISQGAQDPGPEEFAGFRDEDARTT